MRTPALASIRIVLGSALLLGVAVSSPLVRAAELDDVLAHFDEAQASVQTMSASFTETTTNLLLKAPIVAEGKIYMTKPDAIRWEYRTPEEMSFVIANNQYTGYFPEQKRAERRNIQRYSKQIFRFVGLGQGVVELEKFYDISLDPSVAESEGAIGLMLVPKKRRARKRVQDVYLRLDSTSYLPVSIQYRGKDGNSRRIEFAEIRVNPDLAATLYDMELPADVTVTSGFSGLPDFDAAAQ